MIKTIPNDHDAVYQQQLAEAVRALFPILCFTPEQTESFITECVEQPANQNATFADEQGRLTFCRYVIESQGASFIHYIIPSSWPERYQLVKGALQQIKQEFLAANSGHELRMRIYEQLPSHSAYYAGLLPELGFVLTPRVTMIANPALLDQLTLPPLPTGVQEIPYSSDRLGETSEVFLQAHQADTHAETPEKRAQKIALDKQYIAELYAMGQTIPTWVGLTYSGKLIGFACGGLWGNEMSLEELALVPEFHGQGIGRYLAIRCLQTLQMNYAGPERYFGLGTERTNTPALKLYHRIGFTVDKVESYAVFTGERN